MFKNVFLMDCRRCFSVRMFIIIIMVSVILILSNLTSIWMDLQYIINGGEREHINGIVQILSSTLVFDKFKLILVFLMAGIYTNSFCADDSSHYLRMILSRTDATTYTQSRFLANTVSIIAASVSGFLLTTLLLSLFFPITRLDGEYYGYYYVLAMDFPLLYIVIMGIQFGLVVAACCSIGLLFSTFQANKFVSIALPGFVFFLAVSYISGESVFDVLALVAMAPSFIKSFEGAHTVNLIWGILYPVIIIVMCAYFFYRRLKWRQENGNV